MPPPSPRPSMSCIQHDRHLQASGKPYDVRATPTLVRVLVPSHRPVKRPKNFLYLPKGLKHAGETVEHR
jgi:hypothetical protein